MTFYPPGPPRLSAAPSAAAALAAVVSPDPTSELVATDGTPSAHTFDPFTDDDSRIASYTTATLNVDGAMVWTGTDLGPYTASSVANGDDSQLFLYAWSGAGGTGELLGTQLHAVKVTPATTGATWQEVVTYDMEGIDAIDLSGSGSGSGVFTLQKSAVNFLDVTVSRNAAGTCTADAGADGLAIDDCANGQLASIAWDATVAFSKTGASTLTFDDFEEPIAVQFLIRDFVWGNDVDISLILGVAGVLANPGVSATMLGWRVFDTATTGKFSGRRYPGSPVETVFLASQAYATDYVLTVIIHGGVITECWQAAGQTTLPADPRTGNGPYTIGWAAISGATSMTLASTKMMPFFGMARGGLGTAMAANLAAVRILRWT